MFIEERRWKSKKKKKKKGQKKKKKSSAALAPRLTTTSQGPSFGTALCINIGRRVDYTGHSYFIKIELYPCCLTEDT